MMTIHMMELHYPPEGRWLTWTPGDKASESHRWTWPTRTRGEVSLSLSLSPSLSVYVYVYMYVIYVYICKRCRCVWIEKRIREHAYTSIYIYARYAYVYLCNMAVDQNRVLSRATPRPTLLQAFVAAGCFKPFVAGFSRL